MSFQVDAEEIERLRQRIIDTGKRTQQYVPGSSVEPARLAPAEIESLWREHRENMRRVLLEQLASREPRKIGIVGAGRCDSFPLAEFLTTCAQRGVTNVELLDIDRSAMRLALAAAQSQLRDAVLAEEGGTLVLRGPALPNCTAIPIDCTQMMGLVIDRLLNFDLNALLEAEVRGRSVSVSTAMANVISNILNCCIAERTVALPAAVYDLTVSDCVATQINNFVGISTLPQWLAAAQRAGGDSLREMIVAHEGILLRDHLSILAHLTKPGGRILLISDVIQCKPNLPKQARFMDRGTDLQQVVLSVEPPLCVGRRFGPWTWQRTTGTYEEVMALEIDNRH